MNLNFFEKKQSREDRASLPEEIKAGIISRLQLLKDVLQVDEDYSRWVMELSKPSIYLMSKEKKDSKALSYKFNFSGLSILLPDPNMPTNYDIAHMDFTPFGLKNHSPKLAAIAISALVVGIDSYLNEIEHGMIAKPKIIRGETNATMKDFLITNLGYTENKDETQELGVQGNFVLEVTLVEFKKRFGQYVHEQNFDQLFKLLDSAIFQIRAGRTEAFRSA